MSHQELIDSAKVTVTKNTTNRFNTVVIEFPNRTSTWEWANDLECVGERLEYHVKNAATMAYQELHEKCGETPCQSCYDRIFKNVSSPNFVYARFVPCSFGNYYNLYHKDDTSPTGVSLTGGCPEGTWERVAKLTGNSHNYLSPTEGR